MRDQLGLTVVNMQTSGAVLAAVVVVWIFYLVPQLMRRREALGHARIADRDSAQVRLLDRRRRGGDAGPSTEPLHLGAGEADPEPAFASEFADRSADEQETSQGVAEMTSSVLPQSASAVQRRVTVLAMLGSATAMSWIMVPMFDLSAWVGVPATSLLVADLVALQVLLRQRAATAAGRAARRRRVEAAWAEDQAAEAQLAAFEAAEADELHAVRRAAAAMPARTGVTVAGRRRTPMTELVSAGESLTAEGTWVPVPVPPPTYTMKAVVHRERTTGSVPVVASSVSQLPEELGEPVQVEVSPAGPVSLHAAPARPHSWGVDHEWADGLDLDAVLARRRAVNG